ncbi:hypothetical protein L210DRAFT_2654587 [Boletus edulis BED1]|uniref:Uncharacterized protein n=1 Tax=Boletus edulis BED1 TaxID=1328754 RepID=A0AAD4C5L0_BOLED|nr:hypothetical protein L210DRAFT_2654587 [Boletus edulis BED1]
MESMFSSLSPRTRISGQWRFFSSSSSSLLLVFVVSLSLPTADNERVGASIMGLPALLMCRPSAPLHTIGRVPRCVVVGPTQSGRRMTGAIDIKVSMVHAVHKVTKQDSFLLLPPGLPASDEAGQEILPCPFSFLACPDDKPPMHGIFILLCTKATRIYQSRGLALNMVWRCLRHWERRERKETTSLEQPSSAPEQCGTENNDWEALL